jgi:hypothetical protein
VSITSLSRYRRVLVDFARGLGARRLEAVKDVEGTQAA